MMPILPGRHAALRLAFVCAVLIVACHGVTIAAPDTTDHPQEATLFVGHLNFDCVPDTVVGWADELGQYLPHAIRWGRPRVRLHRDATTMRVDTLPVDSGCMGPIPSGRRLAVTRIHYPDWEGLSGSVSFQRMNPDSLTDLLFYIWGKVGDSTEQRDTLRPLLLFGQQGLDTLPVLDVGAIESFQSAPFFAMELRRGSELVEPAVRDLSGVTSYMLSPVAISVRREEEETPGEPSPGDSTPARQMRVRVYPNPAGASAQLEVQVIPPGDYHCDVVAVNGLVCLRQDITVSTSGGVLQTLDLHALPAGYYVIRIASGDQIHGIYPIIITR